MIKGLIAIFTSGILFRPMVLLGVIIGTVSMVTLDNNQLKIMYTTPLLYIGLYAIALIHSLTFGRIFYKTGRTNVKASLLGSFSHFFNLLLAVIFSSLLIYSFSFGFGDDNIQQSIR